jgi:hypothetical protein
MIMMKKSLAALALAAAMSSGVQAQPSGGAVLGMSTGAAVATAFVVLIAIGAASSSSTSHN